MRRVLAAALTELLQLQTARDRLLVLRRRVVPLFALGALHCDDFPHLPILFKGSGFRAQVSVSFRPVRCVQLSLPLF